MRARHFPSDSDAGRIERRRQRARPAPGFEESVMDGIEARDEAKLARSYLERARELLPMLREAGDEIERHRQLPPHIVDALIERGIFKMLLPRSIGGAELSPLTETAVLESLAEADGSTAWSLGQN